MTDRTSPSHASGPGMSGGVLTGDTAVAILVFALAMAVFGVLGFERGMERDNAIYLYGGLQLLEGQLPYLGIFDHKGPMTQFIAGAGVLFSRVIGVEDWFGTRLLFAAMAAASGSFLYLAGRAMRLSWIWALVAAGLLLSFHHFAYHAVSGPRPKTAFVVFECLALLFFLRGRWMSFGVATGLATLVWQPGVLIALAALLAFPRGQFSALFFRMTISGLIVAAVCALIYVLAGRFAVLLDGFALYNFVDLWRPGDTLYRNMVRIVTHVFVGYSSSSFVLIGGIAFALTLVLAKDHDRRFLGMVTALFVVLSILDIQGPVDVFPLLPAAALGLALLMTFMSGDVSGSNEARKKSLFALAVCVAPILALPLRMGWQVDEISEEIARAERIAESCAAPGCIYYLGDTVGLALGGRENASPYGFMLNGIGNYIARVEPGGLAGWLDRMSPEIVVVGITDGPGAEETLAWLERGFVPAPEIDPDAWRRRPADGT